MGHSDALEWLLLPLACLPYARFGVDPAVAATGHGAVGLDELR
jgi:hypothetical protein